MLYLLAFVVFEAAWFVPFRIVFRSARFSTLYAYASLIPMIGPLLCIWILATRPWPIKTKLVRTYS